MTITTVKRGTDEKSQAFRGIIQAVVKQPQSALNDLPYFLHACAEYKTAPEEVEHAMRTLIENFKKCSGQNWGTFYSSLPDDLKNALA